jgi:hypothetical protein
MFITYLISTKWTFSYILVNEKIHLFLASQDTLTSQKFYKKCVSEYLFKDAFFERFLNENVISNENLNKNFDKNRLKK